MGFRKAVLSLLFAVFVAKAHSSKVVATTDSVVAQCAVGYEPVIQDLDSLGRITKLNSGGFTNGEFACTSGQGGRVGVYRSTVSRYNRCTAICPVSAPWGRFLAHQRIVTNGNCRVFCRRWGHTYDRMRCWNGASTRCKFYEHYKKTCCTGKYRGGIAHLLGGSSRVEGCTITGGGYLKADSTFPFYSCFADNSCRLTSVCNFVTGAVSTAVNGAIGKYTK